MAVFTVRQLTPTDLERVAPLFDAYRQFYGKPGDLAGAQAFLRARYDHGESVLLLAEAGADVLGFAQLYPSFSSLSLARTLILNDLFVTSHGRGIGAGRALVAAAAAHGREIGVVSLALSMAKTNHPARAPYCKTGWVRDECSIDTICR